MRWSDPVGQVTSRAARRRHRGDGAIAILGFRWFYARKLDPDVEVCPMDGVADLVDSVDDAGKLLVEAGSNEVIDFDQVEPPNQGV